MPSEYAKQRIQTEINTVKQQLIDTTHAIREADSNDIELMSDYYKLREIQLKEKLSTLQWVKTILNV